MEKRSYDQDELLIRQALGNQFPKNFRIVKEADANMKPRRVLKKGLAMALIAAALMAITVTTVVAYHMGAFERLTGIVGQERADELTPIEIAVGEITGHDGIAIELVAIEMGEYEAYIYFTLQDLVADRLAGDFIIRHSIFPAQPIDGFSVVTFPPEIIHRDAGGVITLRSRFEYSHDLEGLELTYHIHEIRFNDFRHPMHFININLADFAFDVPTVLLQTDSPAVGAMGFGSGETVSRYVEQIREEGLPVLAPHALDIDFGLEGVRSVISNIGVVNGRLHIQLYSPNMREGGVQLWLLPASDAALSDYGHAGLIQELLVLQFRVAEDGTLYRDETIADTHFESVYVLDLSNIHEYALAISAHGSERIDINWRMDFTISSG